MITRHQYLNKESTHNEYYAQFVVTLHNGGNKLCNVARLNGGQVIHHPDPSGNPRPDNWKQALERVLFKRCSCGKWNLREDSFCLCKQPLNVASF